ncbi:MAG: methyltransferase domain-containing protein [Verrucomicrobia bacterium]|nr:methyltransferase domain-containing protein [Verrucomicrobiota bacterium]
MQAEYSDAADRSAAEVADGYRQLARANRVFRFAHPFEYLLPRLLGKERCRSLALLDLGAGDGSMGNQLARWAARQGWDWRFTNLDTNGHALRLNSPRRNVAGSVLALPFRDASFDVVMASQMTHHLAGEAEVVTHFREAWRVTRTALVLSDLHRNAGLYALVCFWVFALGLSPRVRSDGMLSVRRGFRVAEWRSFAQQAGIPQASTWLYLGMRIMLHARKAA